MYVNTAINKIYFDKENNTIKINYQKTTKSLQCVKELNTLLFSFASYFFQKIKFKGKGFRLKIKKNKKICKFLFGHSHTMLVYIRNLKITKCSKYKFILKSVNNMFLKISVRKVLDIKPVNWYTNRGIRAGRQIILKRKGKKGSYT